MEKPKKSLSSSEEVLDLIDTELSESQPTKSTKTKKSRKRRSSKLFNVTQEQVDDPQYWIDL